jgi:septal ring factor EnvC (AmiA/AmiB activator)
MNSRTILIALLLILGLFASSSVAQRSELRQKRSDLEKLRKEIDQFEQKIKGRERKEHATLELLDNYDHQSSLLRKLIGKLQDEEKSLSRDIDRDRALIGNLSERVGFLKTEYARYVTTAYKSGRTYDLELLLTARSLNQMLIRSEYLKRFSEQRRQDIDSISDQRSDLVSENMKLERQLANRRQLIAEKAREEKKLAGRVQSRKALLAEIRKDKRNYTREINRRLEDAKKLEQLVAGLIDREKAGTDRKPRDQSARPNSSVSQPGTGFDLLKGKLSWPVSQGKIIGRFGVQENPTLHTVTQNTGIDIGVSSGTPVDAVAPGEVSTIWWLPSFGNLVIVNHQNGYRTVYAHLLEIAVNEGDVLNEGDQIGKSGEALSGPQLHFEIWKDREKQDPLLWLQPRGLTKR